MVKTPEVNLTLPKLKLRQARFHYPRLETLSWPEEPGGKKLLLREDFRKARVIALWKPNGQVFFPELSYQAQWTPSISWPSIKKRVLRVYQRVYLKAAQAYQATADAWLAVEIRESRNV